MTYMGLSREQQAMEMSGAVNAYLRSKYGAGDKTWHPLFTAARELFLLMMGGK